MGFFAPLFSRKPWLKEATANTAVDKGPQPQPQQPPPDRTDNPQTEKGRAATHATSSESSVQATARLPSETAAGPSTQGLAASGAIEGDPSLSDNDAGEQPIPLVSADNSANTSTAVAGEAGTASQQAAPPSPDPEKIGGDGAGSAPLSPAALKLNSLSDTANPTLGDAGQHAAGLGSASAQVSTVYSPPLRDTDGTGAAGGASVPRTLSAAMSSTTSALKDASGSEDPWGQGSHALDPEHEADADAHTDVARSVVSLPAGRITRSRSRGQLRFAEPLDRYLEETAAAREERDGGDDATEEGDSTAKLFGLWDGASELRRAGSSSLGKGGFSPDRHSSASQFRNTATSSPHAPGAGGGALVAPESAHSPARSGREGGSVTVWERMTGHLDSMKQQQQQHQHQHGMEAEHEDRGDGGGGAGDEEAEGDDVERDWASRSQAEAADRQSEPDGDSFSFRLGMSRMEPLGFPPRRQRRVRIREPVEEEDEQEEDEEEEEGEEREDIDSEGGRSDAQLSVGDEQMEEDDAGADVDSGGQLSAMTGMSDTALLHLLEQRQHMERHRRHRQPHHQLEKLMDEEEDEEEEEEDRAEEAGAYIDNFMPLHPTSSSPQLHDYGVQYPMADADNRENDADVEAAESEEAWSGGRDEGDDDSKEHENQRGRSLNGLEGMNDTGDAGQPWLGVFDALGGSEGHGAHREEHNAADAALIVFLQDQSQTSGCKGAEDTGAVSGPHSEAGLEALGRSQDPSAVAMAEDQGGGEESQNPTLPSAANSAVAAAEMSGSAALPGAEARASDAAVAAGVAGGSAGLATGGAAPVSGRPDMTRVLAWLDYVEPSEAPLDYQEGAGAVLPDPVLLAYRKESAVPQGSRSHSSALLQAAGASSAKAGSSKHKHRRAPSGNAPAAGAAHHGHHSHLQEQQQLAAAMEAASRLLLSADKHSPALYLSMHGLIVVPPSLPSFSHLKTLDLSRNSISTVPPGILPTSLHILDLSYNRLPAIEGLRDLSRLRVLNLSHNKITRIGHGLVGCAALREVYLASNKVGEVEGLHRLLKLAVLDLSSNRVTSTKALSQLAANLNSLKALNLLSNPIHTNLGNDAFKRYVCGLLPNLQVLNQKPVKANASSRDLLSDSKASLGRSGTSLHHHHRSTASLARSGRAPGGGGSHSLTRHSRHGSSSAALATGHASSRHHSSRSRSKSKGAERVLSASNSRHALHNSAAAAAVVAAGLRVAPMPYAAYGVAPNSGSTAVPQVVPQGTQPVQPSAVEGGPR